MGRLGRTRSRAVLLTRLLPFFFCRHLNAFNSDVCGCIVQTRKKIYKLKKKKADLTSVLVLAASTDIPQRALLRVLSKPLQTTPAADKASPHTPPKLPLPSPGTASSASLPCVPPEHITKQVGNGFPLQVVTCTAGASGAFWCSRRASCSQVCSPLFQQQSSSEHLFIFLSCEPCSGDESLRAAICSASGPDALGMGTTYEPALGRPQNPYSCTG